MVAVRWHPPVDVPADPPPALGAARHRSRIALERLLLAPADEAAWDDLAMVYDQQAADWDEWAAAQPTYLAPVAAGLARVGPAAWAVEVACGSGQATPLLAAAADRVVATDVSLAMVRDAPPLPRTSYAVADVRRLPFATGSVPLLLALNAVPHAAEFDRVLSPGGRLLWCSSFGPETPLYVSPERFLTMLGPPWRADAGRAGHGEWLLLSRGSSGG